MEFGPVRDSAVYPTYQPTVCYPKLSQRNATIWTFFNDRYQSTPLTHPPFSIPAENNTKNPKTTLPSRYRALFSLFKVRKPNRPIFGRFHNRFSSGVFFKHFFVDIFSSTFLYLCFLLFVIVCTGGVSYTVGGAAAPPTLKFATPTLCFTTPTFGRFGGFLALKQWFLNSHLSHANLPHLYTF